MMQTNVLSFITTALKLSNVQRVTKQILCCIIAHFIGIYLTTNFIQLNRQTTSNGWYIFTSGPANDANQRFNCHHQCMKVHSVICLVSCIVTIYSVVPYDNQIFCCFIVPIFSFIIEDHEVNFILLSTCTQVKMNCCLYLQVLFSLLSFHKSAIH